VLDRSAKVVQFPDPAKQRYVDGIKAAVAYRLIHLHKFHHVAIGDWEGLAWALIYWHVPGLTITTAKPSQSEEILWMHRRWK
jgi:hypothetical protein